MLLPTPPFPALLSLLLILPSALGHNIQLGPHKRECFHENLHKGDKMTVTFQVGDRDFGGSGNLEIDFSVSLPPPLPLFYRYSTFTLTPCRYKPRTATTTSTSRA